MPRRLSSVGLVDKSIAGTPVQMPPVASDIADTAPSGKLLTSYDKEHLATHLRLLDAHAEGAGWRESHEWCCALIGKMNVIGVRKAFDSHLSGARWMME